MAIHPDGLLLHVSGRNQVKLAKALVEMRCEHFIVFL